MAEQKSWKERFATAEAKYAALEPCEATRLRDAHQQELEQMLLEIKEEKALRVAVERKLERLGKKLQVQRAMCAKSDVELMVQREVQLRQQQSSIPIEIVISERGRLGVRFREHSEQVKLMIDVLVAALKAQLSYAVGGRVCAANESGAQAHRLATHAKQHYCQSTYPLRSLAVLSSWQSIRSRLHLDRC
eukprot:SAG31_NODE_7679_length_1619_cov_1.017763_2_plen_190_part_00